MKSFITTFLFSIVPLSHAFATELNSLSHMALNIKVQKEVVLKYAPGEFEDIYPQLQTASEAFKLPNEGGTCLMSTKTSGKKDKIIERKQVLKSVSPAPESYEDDEYSFIFTKQDTNKDVSLKCRLPVKKVEVLFVDFANEAAKEKCSSQGGDVVVKNQESILRSGSSGKPMKLNFVHCEKRIPKISKEDLMKAFETNGLKLTLEERPSQASSTSSKATLQKTESQAK